MPGIQVCAEPIGYRTTRYDATNVLGIYMMCVAPGTYLVAPTNAPAGWSVTTPGFRLPVPVRPNTTNYVNFGYRQ